MRIIAISDIHNDKEAVLALKESQRGKTADAIIITGDITTHGSEYAAEEILKELKQISKVFAIPGNMDTKEIEQLLENKNISLHNHRLVFENHSLAGYGGGLAGNSGHIFSSEKKIEKDLEKLLDKDCSNLILATHLPPFGTSLDRGAGGKHIGSKAVLKIIEKKQPLLHFCGHAHDSMGEEQFGRTLSVNLGALKDGKATIIDINGRIKIERIELF